MSVFLHERTAENQLTQRTVVTGHLAGWTASLVRDAAYATDVVFTVAVFRLCSCVPSPSRYRVPILDFDLHLHDSPE